MTAGYVYVLTNESMPGIVKIGRSKHGGRKRAEDIYRGATGIPTRFRMRFEVWSEECESLELAVHQRFDDERISDAREFFRISEFDAAQGIMAEHDFICGCVLVDENEFVDPADIHVIATSLLNTFEPHQHYMNLVLDLINAIRFIKPEHAYEAIKAFRIENAKRLKKYHPKIYEDHIRKHPNLKIVGEE